MKIVTWNVNSIGKRAEQLVELISIYEPEIILLQELKCVSEAFPSYLFENEYQIFVNGQKGFNGVAILVKNHIKVNQFNKIFFEDFSAEARYIEIITESGFLVSSVYVPNGQIIDSEKFIYKLNFLDELKKYLNEKKKKYSIVIGGDFNVAQYDIDVKNPEKRKNHVGFHFKEQEKIRSFFDSGFYDPLRLLDLQKEVYSWWDYRSGGFARDDGMRIDYFLISVNLSNSVNDVLHCKDFRGKECPSDHIPIILNLK
jgi:exodeoxyribonuclease-3